MTSHDPSAYGKAWADDYDNLFEHREDPTEVVRFLADRLQPNARILEVGVGTGRLALPLAEAGFKVTGVDASPEMLEGLRERDVKGLVDSVQADFTTMDAGSEFDAAVVAFSTLFLVQTQSDQIAAMANARRHLSAEGILVIEAFVPDHSRWQRGQNVSVADISETGATVKVSLHDPVEQRITMQDLVVSSEGLRLRPNVLRYAWPAELDAMALACGLRLQGRWQDWNQTPFGSSSQSHVSVYAA